MNPPSQNPRPPVTDSSVWLALLENEWRKHRHALTGLLLFWIAGFWILLLFPHPAFHLVVGLLYGVLFAGSLAGADVMDGTEEFSFSQPPGRGPLFLARMVPGLAFILVVGGLGGLASAFDLPQKLWSLVFSSGLTEPFAPVRDRFWYPLAVCLPLAVFAIVFTAAAISRSRGGVMVSWLPGLVGAGSVTALGFLGENLLWRQSNGILTCLALILLAVLSLLTGYLLYLRKEATKSTGQVTGGWWTGILLVAAALLALTLLSGFFMFKRVDRRTQDKIFNAQPVQHHGN